MPGAKEPLAHAKTSALTHFCPYATLAAKSWKPIVSYAQYGQDATCSPAWLSAMQSQTCEHQGPAAGMLAARRRQTEA